MREKNRKPIASYIKLPQFTTMNVIDGQAGLIIYASLIFYSLTIDNILNIIVLLILAGVTIATLTGDNGLLIKSREAVEKSTEGEIKEKIILAVTHARMNDSLTTDREILDNELKKEFGEGNYELLPVGEGFLISINNIEYFVDKDGKMDNGNKIEASNIENAGDLSKGGQYDGLTEDTAYRITCIEDLVEWTNKYNTYKSKNIKLENTIDFNSTSSYNNARAKTTDINENGKIEELITELTTGKGFKPIGDYAGTFDGQNNEIRNIYENTTENSGLLGKTNASTIKNLGVTGKITSTGDSRVGGIIGNAGANCNIKMYNCHSNINIKAENSPAGGLIGYMHGDGCKYSIYNCYNFGNINSSQNYTGGLIGRSYGNADKYIINCFNYGNINGLYVGGLIGYDYFRLPYINNSFNVGDLKSNNKTGALCYHTQQIPNDRFTNAFYLDDGKTDLAVATRNYQGSSLTKEYMQSQEYVDELNSYVDRYNEKHKNDEGFIQLRRWKYNVGNYPTFE